MDVTDYGGGWVGYAPTGSDRPHRPPQPVATWRSTLPGAAFRSTLTFGPGSARADLVAALNRRPEYLPFPWPDRELRDDADLRTLALLKILTVVEFGMRWPSLDPTDLLAHAANLDPALAARTRPWLAVHGEIFPDGTAGFSIADVPGDNEPPDILGGRHDPFIRAAIGAALIELLRQGQGSWMALPGRDG